MTVRTTLPKRSRSNTAISIRSFNVQSTQALDACAMHGIPIFNRKFAVGFSQTLTNRPQGLFYLGPGSDLGLCLLGKKYLKPALTAVYFASRG